MKRREEIILALILIAGVTIWLVQASRSSAEPIFPVQPTPEVPAAALRSIAPSVSRRGIDQPSEPQNPSDGTTELGGAIEAGIASYVASGYGSDYLALPEGPGSQAKICADTVCVVRTSTDAGPDLSMQRAGRVADLSFADFRFLCQCEPSLVGLIHVSVERLGGLTQPPTDVSP